MPERVRPYEPLTAEKTALVLVDHLVSLLTGVRRTADVERYLSAAQGAVQRAAALTHRLLAFSRRETLDPKPTSVNRLINELEDLIRRTVGPSIELDVIGTTHLSWKTHFSTCALTPVTPCRMVDELLSTQKTSRWIRVRLRRMTCLRVNIS